MCRKTNKTRYFFLFSDLLIVCSPVIDKGSISAVGKTIGQEGLSRVGSTQSILQLYTFHNQFDLSTVRASPGNSVPSLSRFTFNLISNHKSFSVFADTLDEQQLWLEDLMRLTGDNNGNFTLALSR